MEKWVDDMIIRIKNYNKKIDWFQYLKMIIIIQYWLEFGIVILKLRKMKWKKKLKK